MENGLAQSMSVDPAQAQGQQQGPDMEMIEQIIELLMDGADPEELVKQGIPPELIMQAIDVLEQQLAAQQGGQQMQQPAQAPQQQTPASPQGLAQSMM
jgi:hypothetical protein